MSQTLNIYQFSENLKPDRSQPTPTQVSEEKKYDSCLQCLESKPYFFLSFSLASSAEQVQVGQQSVLVLQEGKSMGETGRADGHTGKSLGSEPSLREALQLRLRVHTWKLI